MTKGNIPQLTFTRFIAAVAVVVFHYGKQAFPFNSKLLNPVAEEAGITVSYFFFLSGFLLYHVYAQKQFSFREFIVARFARIAPLYWFALALSVVGILVLLQQKPWGGSAVLQALFLQAWFPGDVLSFNYPSWSVSVEMFFYLSFPILLLLSKRIGENRFLLFAMALWILSIGQNIITQHLVYDPNSTAAGDLIMYFPLWHLNTFVCGMAAYILYRRIAERKISAYLPLSFVLFGLATVILIITSKGFVHNHMHLGLLSPFYAMIVCGICLDTTPVSRVLSLKPLQFLGEISYGIYLMQYPVWIGFAYFLPGFPLYSTMGFYTYLGVLIVVCVLVYLGIEKPAREYIRKRMKSPTPEKV
jgi:peptidoglycan/LPS O-acetylase OafA/YrhL